MAQVVRSSSGWKLNWPSAAIERDRLSIRGATRECIDIDNPVTAGKSKGATVAGAHNLWLSAFSEANVDIRVDETRIADMAEECGCLIFAAASSPEGFAGL